MCKTNCVSTVKKQRRLLLSKQLGEKFVPIYQRALEQYENEHPHWRIEVLVSLIKWSLDSLRHYLEDVRDPQITWESPFVELHFPIEWNWKERGSDDVASGGHIYVQLTPENTATQELATETLSKGMAQQFNAMGLADATNWAWYEKVKNYYTPVLPLETTVALNDLKSKSARRECFAELVRPFSIGATRVDPSGIDMESAARDPARATRQIMKQEQRIDIPGIRFSGDVNGRKFDMGLIFEIHPLIADYDQKKAYHRVVVGLAVFREMVGNEPVGDTPARWAKKERQEFWECLLREVGKLADH